MEEARARMKQIMQEDFGVFRDADAMQSGFSKIKELWQSQGSFELRDKSSTFNTSRFEMLECQNMLEVAYTTALGALTRRESRGAHSRVDFPHRNDKEWHHHLAVHNNEVINRRGINMQPEDVEPIILKERDH